MKPLITGCILFLLAAPLTGFGQCDPEAQANTCIPKLTKGFIFLKSYKLDGEEGERRKIEYSYVFSKGRQYQINLCTGTPDDADGIVINVFDSGRKLIGSSKQGGKYLTGLQLACRSAGIYYIQYAFENSKTYCAGSAMGFQ